MKVYVIVPCILLLSLAQSCQPEADPFAYADQQKYITELKEYTYFKEGSYWIYEDSISGAIDSQFVFHAAEGDGYYSDGYKKYWFECFILSAYDTFEYKHRFYSSWTGKNPYRSKVFRAKTRIGDYVGETILIEYPIVPGNTLYWGNGDMITTASFAPYQQVGDSTFYDVVTVTHQDDPTTGGAGECQLARHKGIISQRIDGGPYWRLIRYHVEQ